MYNLTATKQYDLSNQIIGILPNTLRCHQYLKTCTCFYIHITKFKLVLPSHFSLFIHVSYTLTALVLQAISLKLSFLLHFPLIGLYPEKHLTLE